MLTGILAGLAAGALWGLVFVAPRMVPQFSAVEFTAGRYAAYGAVAALVMLLGLRTRRLPTWRQAGGPRRRPSSNVPWTTSRRQSTASRCR